MDPKKIIKRYIMPGVSVRIGAVLSCVLLLITMAVGVTVLNAEVAEPVEFYPSETPTGVMAYIDVVGVSNWLYQYDEAVYYSVEDAYGYLYTVRLSDAQLKEMSAQAEYWNRATETAPMPEAFRLVGYVQATSDDVKQSLAQSWDITVSEYEEYFGVNMLNATTSVGLEKSAGWFLGAFVSFLVGVLCFYFQFKAAGTAKKCLKVLEDRNLLEKAAQQLDNPVDQTVVGKNRGILTQDFLFGKGTGVVLPYSEITWAYKQDQRRNFVAVNSYLMAGTPWLNVIGAIDLNRHDKDGHIVDALARIRKKNPYAMLGYTSENRLVYKSLLKVGK